MVNSVAEESRVEVLLEEMSQRLRAMEQRMRDIEARMAPAPAPAAAAAPVAKQEPAQKAEIPEEILMVIAAAVAAFMGKKARIRRVRRMFESGVNPWSQQGRVSIQGSHNVHWAR